MMFFVLNLRTSFVFFCMLRSTHVTLAFFTCICRRVWDRRERSFVNSKSYSGIQAVHFILVFLTQSTTERKRNRGIKQCYPTLFFSRHVTFSCPPCTTLQFSPSYDKDDFLRYTSSQLLLCLTSVLQLICCQVLLFSHTPFV